MKSIVAFPDDYVVIDLETTGFYEWDEVIELGAVRVRNNIIVDRYQQLIKPECDIPFAVTQLTGISSEMVADSPSIKAVAADFRRFIGNDIVVGHNTNFDIRFFNRCGAPFSEPLTDNYVDTMKLSRKALPELEHHRLCDIAAAMYIPQVSAHRSVADCETTHLCLQAIKQLAFEKYGSFEDFKKLFAKKRKSPRQKLDLRTFVAQSDFFDEDCPLYDKNCVFTGKLERFTRSDAAQIVANLGGHCQNQVTKSTDYLILGNGDFFKDSKSTKHKKAEAIQAEGFYLQIINEDMFYQILNEYCVESNEFSNLDNTLEKRIFNILINLLDPKMLESASLKIQDNANTTSYYTVVSSIKPNTYHSNSASHFFARIKTSGKKQYIAFNNSAKKAFDTCGFKYEYDKAISEDFYRIELCDFFELAENSEAFRKGLNQFFVQSFEFSSFGCCSRYKQCSNIGSCQHEDIIYASASCQYKRHLDKGNNFLK